MAAAVGASPAGPLAARLIRRTADEVDLDSRVLGALSSAGRSALDFLNPFASGEGAAPTPRRFGGRVQPGEVTLVGEDGPEVAKFPAGTEILPAPVDDRALGALSPQQRPAAQPVATATPAPVEDDRVLGSLPVPQQRPAAQPVATATPAPVQVNVAAAPAPAAAPAAVTNIRHVYNITGVTDIERALEVAERRSAERSLAQVGG